jgi:hypothetical protein
VPGRPSVRGATGCRGYGRRGGHPMGLGRRRGRQRIPTLGRCGLCCARFIITTCRT